MEKNLGHKIRYEESCAESVVYIPGNPSATSRGSLADDLFDEWVIGEERPWWYFRL